MPFSRRLMLGVRGSRLSNKDFKKASKRLQIDSIPLSYSRWKPWPLLWNMIPVVLLGAGRREEKSTAETGSPGLSTLSH
jgi:hypothetical protein